MMGIIDAFVEKALDFFDKISEANTPTLIADNFEETEEQQLRRRAEIEQALDDMHRLERMVSH